MIYGFGKFRIDLTHQELWCGEALVDIEPMAFELLRFLIEHRDRLVTKEELFTVLWGSRAVSDAALSTCIKSARRSVEDAGDRQKVIKTVYGRGLRWMAVCRAISPAAAAPDRAASDLDDTDEIWVQAAKRPSIAILPFETIGRSTEARTLSKALPHELIATISRLRWIAVIARGSAFRFQSATGDLDDIRRKLGVRYCLTGSVEVLGRRIVVSVVLSNTQDREVIWADRFKATMEDVHEVRETIIGRVIVAVEIQIPLSEAAKARLRSPENIDAWANYHLGLQSLYRFEERENSRSIGRFERALALEPRFARAHAAMSFAHFKTAFMHYGVDRGTAVSAALAAAERAINLDPMDPFANFNMGRALWLVGDLEGAKGWLDRSTSISPNFAQGIYARAWTETVSGSSTAGRRLSDEARLLSPLDPLLYAMLGTRAMSLAIEGRDEEAAAWAVRAATAPGAHDLISVIAVFTNELAGNSAEARRWAERVRGNRRDITQQQFFRSFPFTDGGVRARLSGALARHGILET